MMKYKFALLFPILLIAACADGKLNINPVKLSYTYVGDKGQTVTLTENVGDGAFGLTVDLNQPIDLGNGHTLDVVLVEPAK